MADPDPHSALGTKLASVEREAQGASERSEAFRESVDTQALLKLRAKRGKDKDAWSQDDDKALAKVIKSWTTAVDDDLARNTKTLTEAGFDVATLKKGKALTDEKTTVSTAASAAVTFRKSVKGDTPLTDRQRTTADALIATLTGLVQQGAGAAAEPTSDAERITAIDKLAAAATKRLTGYTAAERQERLKNLQASLKDAGWVLGDNAWNAKKEKWEIQVVDPSPAQLADRGFFTLRDHSKSGPGGKAQPGAFDVPFIKAMVKHGFNMLAYYENDSMHFELRWKASAIKKNDEAKVNAKQEAAAKKREAAAKNKK
jgi:hypothetical protein